MEDAEPKNGEIPNHSIDATRDSLVEVKGTDVELMSEAKESEIEPALETKEVEIQSTLEAEEGEIEPTSDAKKSEIDPERVEKELSPSVEAEASNGNGIRTLTMRQLLDELKEEENGAAGGKNGRSWSADPTRDDGSDARRSSHAESSSFSQNDISMDLINKVTGVDEEGRSRQRILLYAAKKYVSAIQRNPEDHDALYNWALVLQESADNVGPDSVSSKDALLEEACKKYEEATRLCPMLYDAYYNWAIAISDRAKMRGRTKEAEELWKQALNNWGLALQELGAIVPVREKQTIIRTAISKVADTWDSLYGWLDAIRLVYTIFARGKSDVLAGIITDR
ncbi:hypothetical protein MUK42_20293 [Musa troglodytarum]|uniref:Uncharacterized protein n=1 Tax=Musa troglodytarum TaxID=320322 RepID=A0A9E7FWS3_9LILI|nr:hypothetical protein MUK42_20293 [Musa troglodytarum]